VESTEPTAEETVPQPPPPTTPEEVAALETWWLENVYKGHRLAEFTLQVFVVSVLLSGLMIAFNIYMGLKTGWTEGGAIISVILGFAIIRGLGRKYTTLENNITQTFASAAGSLGNIVNVIPALILLEMDGIIAHGPTFTDVLLWVFFSSFLGVFFAIPLRRQTVVIDQLVFPTGTAAARTIEAMHDTGAAAMRKARALGVTGLVSGLFTWLRDGPGGFLPGAFMAPAKMAGIGGIAWQNLTIGAAASPMMLGAGFLVGPRVGISLAIGGFVAWGILAPLVHVHGIDMVIATQMTASSAVDQCTALMADPAFPDGLAAERLAWFQGNCRYMWSIHTQDFFSVLVKWTMWPGIGVMVAAGLTGFAIKLPIVLRGLRSSLSRRGGGASPIAHLELPTWQWAVGLLLAGVGVTLMLVYRFGVPWYFGPLAIGLSFILAVIAVRATGETDINPVGAMGHVTQIAFGTLQTGSAAAVSQITTANLLTGGVAAAGASEAADMMQDLKAGWLVGSTPRKLVYAQLLGVLFGSVFCSVIFWVLIQAHPIGSTYWPAPAGITWSGVATMMAQGTAALPPYALLALLCGVVVGMFIPLLGAFGPKWIEPWLPAAIGVGVAFVVPYIYSFSIFLGSAICWVLRKRDAQWANNYASAVGAGGIAGEGLAGVLAAVFGRL